LAADLGKLGLLGMHLEGYGCGGSTATAYGLVCQELEAVDSGLRSLVSVQGSLAMYAIYRHGSEEQRKQWLPAMATGDVIGCFGLTEPDFGSNPAGMRTTARRDGSDWILNGAKMWITNGTIADIAIVWARAEEGIVGFIVQGGTPGFTARDMTHKMSLRASVTSACPLRPSCLRPVACRVRSPVCRRHVSGSCSEVSARHGTAYRPPWTTWAPARCSKSLWRLIN
jgi:glutaryl-CoA dehydrogenase